MGGMFVKQNAKTALFWGVLIECAVVLCAVTIGQRPQTAVTAPTDTRPLILLDAGHGGEDGGALAPDGTCEKDLNLDLTLTLRDTLTFCGCRVATTRDTDTGLGEGDTVRARKVSDMKARLALYDAADVVLSVHQNKFGDTACRGAQFFYSQNAPESQLLAETVRNRFVALVQPDNTRELKIGGDNVFLLYKTQTPAVLAECGFLSNSDDLATLKDQTSRDKIALALAGGVLDYLG